MPFTPAHIVAIVPVAAWCRWLPFSALAIGCMMPDLPLFFPGVLYAQTHDPVGVLTVDVPLGVVAFMLFQCVLKVPLFALMPLWVQQRSVSYSRPLLQPSVGFFIGVAVAIAIGAYSHIVWDAFTHRGRWGTELLPLLNREIFFAGKTRPLYGLFQLGSSAAGLFLLAVLAWRQLWRNEPNAVIPTTLCVGRWIKILVWSILLLVPTSIAIAIYLSDDERSRRIFLAITRSGATFVVLMVLYAVIYQLAALGRMKTQYENPR